ncbi:MAG: T9SS type A sorting domain-containing protein [Bacteroidetes bacterium]|nr:T9SS type A sorting domain-containing protein [Bacteroidota bacterium]
MSIIKLILTACALFLSYISFSQPICGFDPVHHKMMREDSAYRIKILRSESSLREFIRQNNNLQNQKGPKTLAGPLYIPVVVHVVHTGGAVGTIYNPDDATIQGAINYLNAVYGGTYPGLEGVGDLGVQFVLAKRDPNCNPTNGITRNDGSFISGYTAGGVQQPSTTGPGVDELNIKNLIRWDPTQYYNIWVVNKISGNDGTSGTFVAGYAYFPGDPVRDGTIMLATQMIAGQKTLPHEIGHAFNLYHPFEGSPDAVTCPANTDCTVDGDQVCDTDPITYNQTGGVFDFTCRTGTNTCAGGPYSINTEHNFMNYTTCYTLFTAGQKVRLLASAVSPDRLSLTTSLGGTAPDVGPTPCVPKINFELDNDQKTETTTASSGCRSYTDYTYNMLIGSNPSITATATLSVSSGTATEGVDFDITTNGSFAAPSKVLTFPAGVDGPQSFTVRVYDDASVESTESFTLDFTVNNNGGNAVKGDGKPNLVITINDNDVAPVAGTANGTVNVGTATAFFTSTPFNATQQKHRVQFLYRASELTAASVPAGVISGISLRVKTKLSTRSFTGLTIKLGTAAVNNLVNGSVTQGSSMTTVKTLASYNTIAGWNDFVFDSPYTWDGVSNLVVEICFDNGSAAPGDAADQIYLYSDGSSALLGNIFWQDGINCSEAFTSVTYQGSGYKPVAKILYGISPTAVQTVLNSSKTEYLGAFSDIYFYDQSNSKLMARIQNLSSFDYGCTQVVLDRQGTSATPFWNNTISNYIMDKTFHVLPTNNSPTGSYIITVYYTQAEVNGWQTATGQSINNIQLIKTANQISLVTPGNPTGAGTMVIGTPTVSTLGTNTGISYNFITGFSGFGAGVVGAILPIHILNFQGRLQNDYVQLDWSTPTEQTDKQFDVERSYDGNNFVKISSVAASQSKSTTTYYSFTDPDIAHLNNYYRLKQINLDGKYDYSKIVLVEKPADRIFKILNNPFTNYVDVQPGKSVIGNVYIRLLDVSGKELIRGTKQSAGNSIIHIDLSQKTISAGIYLLEITFNNEKHIERILKQ